MRHISLCGRQWGWWVWAVEKEPGRKAGTLTTSAACYSALGGAGVVGGGEGDRTGTFLALLLLSLCPKLFPSYLLLPFLPPSLLCLLLGTSVFHLPSQVFLYILSSPCSHASILFLLSLPYITNFSVSVSPSL